MVLIWVKSKDNVTFSRSTIGALVDVWDVVVIEMPAKELWAELAIAPLSGRGSGDFDISMLTALSMIVVFVALIALEVNLRSGVMTEMLARTVVDVTSGICADVSVGVDANMWPALGNALEFIYILTTSEEALISGWEACS